MLLYTNQGVKPTWFLRETVNSALEADPAARGPFKPKSGEGSGAPL